VCFELQVPAGQLVEDLLEEFPLLVQLHALLDWADHLYQVL